MFAQEISLWAGGPVLTLGDYFIWFRYLVGLGFLLLGLALLRWRRPFVLLGGSILLAALSWLAFGFPLGRPYGLVDGSVALEELAEPMVAAATGSPANGAVVGESNPWPLWSLLLAAGSGFDPARLLASYHWLPLVSLVVLALSTYVAMSALSPSSSSDGMAAALGVFFVLFLSVPRLGFLESETLLWNDLFPLRPRLAVGLALTLLAFRGFARAGGVRGFALGGALLGVAAWTEPRWLFLGAAGVALWSLLSWRSGEPVWGSWVGLGVAWGLVRLFPAKMIAAPAPAESLTWHLAVKSLLSVSLDQGAVFYLALFLVGIFRQRQKGPLLAASSILVAYLFWLVVSLSDEAAVVLDRGIVKSFLRVLLAAAAAWGVVRVLIWLDEIGKRVGSPELLRGRSLQSIGLALIPALALPWVFPFWWNPVRMDEVYRESHDAISREYVAFGEWIRESTAPDAVFLAGPSYATWIPALSGRRVLLGDEPDPERRRAQEWIAASRDPEKIRSASERWGVTHLAWGRLDADDRLAIDFEFLESSPLFSLVHQQRRWVRVFEIR